MPPDDPTTRPSQPPDVDFVIGDPSAGPDEELSQPGAAGRGSSRLPVVLGLGAIVVLVALLIARGVDGSGSSDQASAPSASPAAGSSAAGSSAGSPGPSPVVGVTGSAIVVGSGVRGRIVGIPRLPQRKGDHPRDCPGLTCGNTGNDAVPQPVRDALRAAFPGSVVEHAETIRLRDTDRSLWFREVDANAGSERIQLIVQAQSRHDTDRGGVRQQRHGTVTYYEHSLGEWFVIVRVTDHAAGLGRVRGRAQSDRVGALAGDERVLAT